jgi:transcription factor E2F3
MKSEIDNAQSSKRDENSLFTLTKKFIRLLNSSPENCINMTHAASLLGVGKRRIYDITNVLEGIGMISKWSVNSVKWVGGNVDEILSSEGEENAPCKDNKEKNREEIELDDSIEKLNREIAELSQDQKNIDNAYVTYEDLENLKIFQNKIVFALKAPSDCTMEYPRYYKGSYRLKVMTDKGQISVYYVNNDK